MAPTTVPNALALRFLRNFRKLTAKNTTKLENFSKFLTLRIFLV